MNIEIAPSRLFQDLLTLERDFKYNLSLLQIRDAEIKRCNKENRVLQETLNFKTKKLEESTLSYSYLQKTLREIENSRSCELQVCQETVRKLKENLKETREKFQLQIESNKNDLNMKQKQLENFYLNLLEHEKYKYQVHLKAIEESFHNKNNNTVESTKNQLDSLIEEKILLEISIEKMKSEHASEKYLWKTEVETLNSVNSNLNSEIEYFKESCASLKTAYDQVKYKNDNYKIEMNALDEKICNLIEENKENFKARQQLKSQIVENENLYRDFILENKELSGKNEQLEIELEDVKKRLNTNLIQSRCNILSHANYDFIINQNQVLQELVKKMRKEREKFIEDFNESEKRVQNLEKLLKTITRCEGEL